MAFRNYRDGVSTAEWELCYELELLVARMAHFKANGLADGSAELKAAQETAFKSRAVVAVHFDACQKVAAEELQVMTDRRAELLNLLLRQTEPKPPRRSSQR